MEIKNKTNQPIENMEDWVIKTPIQKKDWVEGRSAYSLADFILNKNGTDKIRGVVENLLKDEVVFERAIPELEVKFDKFSGRGRFHDLGIYGKTKSDSKSIFVGVESKVDETFGQTISEKYIAAITERLNGNNTNAPDRVENLLKQNFGGKIREKYFDMRYQFLYSTMGTLEVKKDISILFIIVFKTNSYDEMKGKENYRDYCQYIQNVDSTKISCDFDNVEAHKLIVDNRALFSVYMEVEKEQEV